MADPTAVAVVTTSGPRADRAQQVLGVISDEQPWALLVAGLVTTAVRALGEHRRDLADTCQECGDRWPCDTACTAEMNLALVRA